MKRGSVSREGTRCPFDGLEETCQKVTTFDRGRKSTNITFKRVFVITSFDQRLTRPRNTYTLSLSYFAHRSSRMASAELRCRLGKVRGSGVSGMVQGRVGC